MAASYVTEDNWSRDQTNWRQRPPPQYDSYVSSRQDAMEQNQELDALGTSNVASGQAPAPARVKSFNTDPGTMGLPALEPVCLCRMRHLGQLTFQTWYSFSKTLLYLLEFIWSAVVFGVTANTLYIGDTCTLSDTNSTALCRYAIALGVIGWIAVLVVAVAFFVSSVLLRGLSYVHEAFIHAFLIVWWFIGSVIISSNLGGSSPNSTDVNTVVAFSP